MLDTRPRSRTSGAYGAVFGVFLAQKLAGKPYTVTAKAKARLLLLAGEPLHEPVVSHGPFVMNTEEEIHQAFRDYQLGKMGVWK